MSEDHTFHRRDAIEPSLRSAALTGTAGVVASAVQATLTKQNIGALGAFTRYGGNISVFAAMGGGYEFARLASANLRETNDTVNEAIGGFVAGALLGMRFRTIPAVLGYGTALSVTMAAFQYTGGSFIGHRNKNENVDEYERKETLRANKRRPIAETLEELGEGRGIYGPGYEERRRERIRQRYGIEVP